VYTVTVVAGSGSLLVRATYLDDVSVRSNVTIGSRDLTNTITASQTVTIIYIGSGNVTWNTTGYKSGTYNVRIRVKYLVA
jgi:hypothetical protein